MNIEEMQKLNELSFEELNTMFDSTEDRAIKKFVLDIVEAKYPEHIAELIETR